jgi:hypothetical protein
MLDKIKGCSVVTKLRSILLMEADFSMVNKIIYGRRMLQNVRKYIAACRPRYVAKRIKRWSMGPSPKYYSMISFGKVEGLPGSAPLMQITALAVLLTQ